MIINIINFEKKMISKTRINKKIKRKRNPEIIETINLARKKNFLELANKLARPVRLYKKVNLDELEKIDKEKIMVIGKILGSGNINKKIEISALGFSKQAIEKLKKADCKIIKIKDLIKNNKNLDEIEIIS